MQTTHLHLRKVGGSVMLAVPPAILEQLRLKAGTAVALAIEGERLIMQSRPKPRYTLDELLAASDYLRPMTPEEQEWLDAPPVGRELL
jgi:antitoxin ChpS